MVQVPESLLAKLKSGIACRRIEEGIACLQAHEELLVHLNPEQENSGQLMCYLAQWIDIGFDRTALLKELLSKVSKQMRAGLPLRDYLYLRMTEGMLAMNEEASQEAVDHFDVILALKDDFGDQDNVAVTHFWKARCLRKTGDYEQALIHTLKARTVAVELGHPKMAAVMRVLESWLVFQQGKPKSAERILREAEQVLRETDDFVALGNIHSSYGRIARREGHYDKAIHHFTLAISEYRKRGSHHPHLARSLANIALVQRLVSLQLGRKIDAQVSRRRKAAARGHTVKGSTVGPRSRLEQMRQQAFAHLDEAATIYRSNGSHHGIGTVHLVYGYLYLDDGDCEHAEQCAVTGFELALQKNDYIIMSRLRLLQCMVENAKVEYGIGERANPALHGKRALAWAQEAIRFAKQTQNRRLLANAYVWEGLTYCNPAHRDYDAARKSYESASALMRGDHGGQLWEDLQSLKLMFAPTVKVDDKLRAWSQGCLGEKTFQQILEEFTELIIPKVWDSEGRKISRVAERLSISPKKVRRILQTAGIRHTTVRKG